MFFVRPLLRALANALAWFAALWGFQVSADLDILIGLAAVVGLANFALAVHDERRVEAERRLVGDLREFLRTAMGPADIPPHLQDLSRLSNKQLKALVAVAADKLRNFERTVVSPSRSSVAVWWDRPDWEQLSEEGKSAAFHEHGAGMAQEYQRTEDEWRQSLCPDAKALWEQLKTRVQIDPDERLHLYAIEHGSLAGAYPIEEAVTALESVARRLPDR